MTIVPVPLVGGHSASLCELSEGACLGPFTETDAARLGRGQALLSYYSFSSVYPILLPFLISNSKSKPPTFCCSFSLDWLVLFMSQFFKLAWNSFCSSGGPQALLLPLLIVGMSDLNDHSWPRKKQLFLFVCLCFFGLHCFFLLELSPPYCHSHLYITLASFLSSLPSVYFILR